MVSMSSGFISFKRDCCDIPASAALAIPSKLLLFKGIPSTTISGALPLMELIPLIWICEPAPGSELTPVIVKPEAFPAKLLIKVGSLAPKTSSDLITE